MTPRQSADPPPKSQRPRSRPRKAAETPSEGLLAAARSDDRLRALKALRDRLATEIEGCESKRDMASLSLRFMDAVEQIEALEADKPAEQPKETGLSDFERRLRERQAKAARRSASG